MCPRADMHLTYMTDIPLITEFPLAAVGGGR